MDDMELLRDYATRHSEEAFTTLVTRHIDLVYSAALRHTRNHHQAQEITQAVFVVLARKAPSLNPRTVLAGWLFQTARLTAANHVRGEIRRARREQEAVMQSDPNDREEDAWKHVTPILNEIIGGLREKDRDAVVLRFLQGKDYRQVAAALGATEEAAQMRVSRALEKMRKMFARRGVALSAAALGGALAAQGTQAAPANLAATVVAGAIHSTALGASALTLTEGTLKIMAWINAKTVIGASVVVLLAVQHHQNAAQARQIADARQQLNGQAEALAAEDSHAQELERQTASILETESSQQKDLERLRARRKTVGQGGQSVAGRRAPSTLLAATLSDPDAREALRQQLLSGSRSRLSPLIKELKLDDQTADKLAGIGADWGMKNIETAVAFTEGTLTAEAAVQAGTDNERNATNQVRQLLGTDGFTGYQENEKQYPVRTLVDQFNKQLGPFPMNAIQREALSRVIEAEPLEVATGLAGDFTVSDLVSPNGLDGHFAAQTESNQRILQAAAGFLSSEQVESLRVMQVSNMSAQKQTVLRMLRKL